MVFDTLAWVSDHHPFIPRQFIPWTEIFFILWPFDKIQKSLYRKNYIILVRKTLWCIFMVPIVFLYNSFHTIMKWEKRRICIPLPLYCVNFFFSCVPAREFYSSIQRFLYGNGTTCCSRQTPSKVISDCINFFGKSAKFFGKNSHLFFFRKIGKMSVMKWRNPSPLLVYIRLTMGGIVLPHESGCIHQNRINNTPLV